MPIACAFAFARATHVKLRIIAEGNAPKRRVMLAGQRMLDVAGRGSAVVRCGKLRDGADRFWQPAMRTGHSRELPAAPWGMDVSAAMTASPGFPLPNCPALNLSIIDIQLLVRFFWRDVGGVKSMSRTTTRRALLAQAATLGAALALGPSCTLAPAATRTERRDLYPQGVASGDPMPDSVILWTRRAPDAGHAMRLMVEVAGDEAFAHVVARGDVEVSAATDWTCRFLAAGLKPASEYWYRFVDEADMSRVGRTLTSLSRAMTVRCGLHLSAART